MACQIVPGKENELSEYRLYFDLERYECVEQFDDQVDVLAFERKWFETFIVTVQNLLGPTQDDQDKNSSLLSFSCDRASRNTDKGFKLVLAVTYTVPYIAAYS